MGRARKKPKPLGSRAGVRRVEMTPELHEALLEQKQRFREKFGRDPGPDDPVFFDGTKDEPAPMSTEQASRIDFEVGQALKDAGVSPAYIYAFRKTGLLLTEGNWDKLDSARKREWEAAIKEYESIQ